MICGLPTLLQRVGSVRDGRQEAPIKLCFRRQLQGCPPTGRLYLPPSPRHNERVVLGAPGAYRFRAARRVCHRPALSASDTLNVSILCVPPHTSLARPPSPLPLHASCSAHPVRSLPLRRPCSARLSPSHVFSLCIRAAFIAVRAICPPSSILRKFCAGGESVPTSGRGITQQMRFTALSPLALLTLSLITIRY
jgi:hypothetical protein